MKLIGNIFQFGTIGLLIQFINYLIFSFLIYIEFEIYVVLIIINILGFSIKFVTYNYFFNYQFTIEKYGIDTFIKYLLFYVFAYFLNLIVLKYFNTVHNHNIYQVQLLFMLSFGIISYYFTKIIFSKNIIRTNEK